MLTFRSYPWWCVFLADLLHVFLALLGAQVAALWEPARMLEPRVVVTLPVTQTAVTEETLDIVALTCKPIWLW